MAIPHITLPFRLDRNGGIAWAEQDTVDEIVTCAETIKRYPADYRPEYLEFGSDDLVFEQKPLQVDRLAQQLERFEPRANAVIEEVVDRLEESHAHLIISIEGPENVPPEPARFPEVPVVPPPPDPDPETPTDPLTSPLTVWTSGADISALPPTPNNSDLFLDKATSIVHRYTGGLLPRGSEWLVGVGPPSEVLGAQADFYLDTATGNVWANQAESGQYDIAEPQWFYGPGAPSIDAQTGDYYLDTLTGDVYLGQ